MKLADFRRLLPSIRALLAHKVRASFALLSVAAGVAAVVLTSAVGRGAELQILRETAKMGSNLLAVRPTQVNATAGRKELSGLVTTLDMGDYEAMTRLPLVAEAAPGAEAALTVRLGGGSMTALVLGTTPNYLEIGNFQLREGRFLNADDNRAALRVAVLGARIDHTLFDEEDPIGREIRIRGDSFKVIGVLSAKGILADSSDEDNLVLIPIRTALRRVFNSTWLNPVFISVRRLQDMDAATAQIGELLKIRHRLALQGKADDFSIQNPAKTLAMQKQAADSLGLLTDGLAAGSLVVGGVGILAIMLMSVKERTGEIGLRMAVGARPRDILTQFLLEAALLSLGGWLVGMALGAVGGIAIAFVTSWKIAAPGQAILASLAMAVTTGLGFGAYPARRASMLPPIQALQVE
jgi:putative ABC transport system permease protein